MTTLAQDLATRSQTLGQQLIANQSPWYENGVFYQWDMSNYHRMGFPHAALMATLAKYTTNPALKARYIQMIGEVVDFALATNLNSAGNYFVDGGLDPYGYYGQYPDAQAMNANYIPGATTTIEQVHDLAWILWQLPASEFPAGKWTSWLHTCQLCATQLDTRPGNSITTYYINGNFQAQLMGCYWFTAAVSTGVDKLYYQDCYERAYNFMVKPYLYQPVSFPSPWGLTIDVAGGFPDWSDYQVHLTETNTRGADPRPDYDPNYTTVQMDALARIFLANRDTRLIRLINGMSNKNAALYTRATHILDGTGGSRQHNIQGYINCYFEIQALLGAKGASVLDLTQAESLLRWNDLSSNMLGNSTTGYYGLQAGLSRTIAPILAASHIAIDATVAAA